MRTPTLSALAVLAATLGLATPVTASPNDSHLRCLSGGCGDLIAHAVERSPMIGSLVNELERSDVVVYLHLPGAMPVNEPPSRLLFVSAAGGRRYLVVEIDPWRTAYPDRIALLGHELYHALEVARAREVTDIDTFKRLYRQIGHEYGVNGARFETDEAKRAEREVRRDLTGSRAEAMARDRERVLSPLLLDGRG